MIKVAVALLVGLSISALPTGAQAESIDGRVVQMKMWQDITLYYLETPNVFTVELRTQQASVQAQRLYIGDGTIALELVAHSSKGITLQGIPLKQGDEIKKNSKIQVKPGYKKATELVAGDIYVTLPSVIFEMPSRLP